LERDVHGERKRLRRAGQIPGECDRGAELTERARPAEHAAGEDRWRDERHRHAPEHEPSPSARAASSYRRSIDRSPASTVRTRNGIETNVAARIAPVVVKGMRIPNTESSAWPNRPRRPKAKRSATPPTTGGRIIGRVVSARTTSRPRNGTRA